jgi:hypothetical protein
MIEWSCSPVRIKEPLGRSHVLPLAVLFAMVACGGGGPTKTETFTGAFMESGVDRFSLANFDGDVDATLTWTVPAQETHPIAELALYVFGIPDRLQAIREGSTPPITLRGSGTYVRVTCTNCRGIAPIPFTLTIIER